MPARAKAKAEPASKTKAQPKKGDSKKADPKQKAAPTPKASTKRVAAGDGADRGSTKKGRT